MNERKHLRDIQSEQREWSDRNFGPKKAHQPILGAAEEVGELAHAYLKMEQGIRGTKEEHLAAMKDAVADCTIFLIEICNQMGWDYEDVLNDTWNHVKKRDWRKDSLQDTVQKGKAK